MISKLTKIGFYGKGATAAAGGAYLAFSGSDDKEK